QEFAKRPAVPAKSTIASLKFLAVAIGGLALLAHAVHANAADHAAERTKLDAKIATDLAEVATWCDQQKLPAEAKQAREWSIRREPGKVYIFVLPDALEPPAKLNDDAKLAEWWTRWIKLRRAQADAFFEL